MVRDISIDRSNQSPVRLKVLVSAYACEPGLGSEPAVGWSMVIGLAQQFDVWVITRANNQPVIEAELKRRPIANLHFIFYDLPAWVRFWKRGLATTYIYYYLWQFFALSAAKDAHAKIKFDVAHHLTFVTYYRPSFLSFLSIPFVWGPLGGADHPPLSYWWGFGPRGFLFHLLRWSGIRLSEFDPFVRVTAKRSAFTLAATRRTKARLETLFRRPVGLISQLAFSPPIGRKETRETENTNSNCTRPEQINELTYLLAMPFADESSFRFVSIGQLHAFKGIHLALEAFARNKNTNSEYWIIGEGRERKSLERLAEKLSIAQRVKFLGRMSRSKVFERLGACHVVVHPSTRESGGWVCLEGMAAGRPVICLDIGGPAMHVEREVGIQCSISSPSQTIAELTDAMNCLAADRKLCIRMGNAGRERVVQRYLVGNRVEFFSKLYVEAIARNAACEAVGR